VTYVYHCIHLSNEYRYGKKSDSANRRDERQSEGERDKTCVEVRVALCCSVLQCEYIHS